MQMNHLIHTNQLRQRRASMLGILSKCTRITIGDSWPIRDARPDDQGFTTTLTRCGNCIDRTGRTESLLRRRIELLQTPALRGDRARAKRVVGMPLLVVSSEPQKTLIFAD